MKITTIRHSEAKHKPFAWSYSKLKNFETCPKRHYHVDVVKDVQEGESEQLSYGNLVHKSLANRISKGAPLPKGLADLEKWAAIVVTGPGNIMVEQQLAIDKMLSPCTWFGANAWYRAIADVIKINGPVALAIDWKTGKIVEDSQQLALMSACVFAHHPDVQRIRTEFIWLKEDATSRADFARTDMPKMWRDLWPRIQQLSSAYESQEYPAKPNRLCRSWCPVRECEHNGQNSSQ
jgi:hypothetical protein